MSKDDYDIFVKPIAPLILKPIFEWAHQTEDDIVCMRFLILFWMTNNTKYYFGLFSIYPTIKSINYYTKLPCIMIFFLQLSTKYTWGSQLAFNFVWKTLFVLKCNKYEIVIGNNTACVEKEPRFFLGIHGCINWVIEYTYVHKSWQMSKNITVRVYKARSIDTYNFQKRI